MIDRRKMASFPLLLDRDGTVIVDRRYLHNPADIILEKNAVPGLRAMVAIGAIPVIVTNQSGVGRGMFAATAVDAVHHELDRMLRAEGVEIAGYYSCPHMPSDHCPCRKPKPGLALQAATEIGLDLGSAVVVGDKMSDLGLAKAIGARGIIVRTGKGSEYAAVAITEGFEVADDLLAVSEFLVGGDVHRHEAVTGNAQGAARQPRE
jgi:D-glycero-D-manno-heptose 1,7-bisphosphate phosphatase